MVWEPPKWLEMVWEAPRSEKKNGLGQLLAILNGERHRVPWAPTQDQLNATRFGPGRGRTCPHPRPTERHLFLGLDEDPVTATTPGTSAGTTPTSSPPSGDAHPCTGWASKAWLTSSAMEGLITTFSPPKSGLKAYIMHLIVHSFSELATSSPWSSRRVWTPLAALAARRWASGFMLLSGVNVRREDFAQTEGRVQLALRVLVVEACQHFLGPHEHVRGELAAFAVHELGVISLHALGPRGEVLGRLLVRHGRGRSRGRGWLGRWNGR